MEGLHRDHNYQWPENYHLLLDPTSAKIHLHPNFNPMEWEPLETYLDGEATDDISCP